MIGFEENLATESQRSPNPDYGIQFVAFSGPRTLSGEQRQFVCEVTLALIENVLPNGALGRKILAGCSIGADAVVIEEARKRKAPFRIYSILDQKLNGGWKDTNRAGLDLAAFEGSEVVWLAGGPLTESVGARLKMRTHRMLEDVVERGFGSGVIAFWAQTRGTEVAIETAVSLGLPVVLYPLAEGIEFPKLKGGRWVKRNAEGIKGRGWVFRKS